MLYTAGRGWIEYLRIDDVQMDDVLGLRLNVWTSIVLFVLAAAWFAWSARRRPGREDVVRTRPAEGVEGHDDDIDGGAGTPEDGPDNTDIGVGRSASDPSDG